MPASSSSAQLHEIILGNNKFSLITMHYTRKLPKWPLPTGCWLQKNPGSRREFSVLGHFGPRTELYNHFAPSQTSVFVCFCTVYFVPVRYSVLQQMQQDAASHCIVFCQP